MHLRISQVNIIWCYNEYDLLYLYWPQTTFKRSFKFEKRSIGGGRQENYRLLLTLSHPLRTDVHGSFHSLDIDPMVAITFLAASLTYWYLVEHLNPAYR